jgi:hypothetical protein
MVKDIENNVLEDFINVTGLIRRDGAESYTFVHRTIQEYHAAEYIKSCSSKTKSKILNKLLTEIPNNRIMVNTAVFLNHIDNENTIEELIIPLMEQFGFNEEKIDYKKACQPCIQCYYGKGSHNNKREKNDRQRKTG